MSKESPAYLAAKYGGIIFLLPSCMLLGFWLGRLLDDLVGIEPVLTVVFFLLGAAAGFLQVFRLVMTKK